MEYYDKDELRRILTVAHDSNKMHHLCMLIGFWHGARVSEIVGNGHHPGLQGRDISSGLISISRLKGSKDSLQPLHIDQNPVFDESPVIALAEQNSGKLFNFSRQRVHQFMQKYGGKAGIHPDKNHFHSMKHSIAMMIFNESGSIGQVQNYLGHRAETSSICYLREKDNSKANRLVQGMKL